MNQLELIPDSDIERAADIAAKHARERAVLEGKHENERRELQRRQLEEVKEYTSNPTIGLATGTPMEGERTT